MTLNDICSLITCGVAARPEYVENGIPFLSSKNVKENRIILDDYNCVSDETHKKLTKYSKPEKGDILYTRVGSFGEAAIIDIDLDFSIFVSLTLIKPKHDIVYNRYLMHFLNSPRVRSLAENSTSGIGVQNLNVNAVRKFPIELPPLETQIKIANALDKADSIRQKDKQIIQKYDELLQSVFLEMFGDFKTNNFNWPKLTIEELCDDIVDCPHSTPIYVEGPTEFPCIRTTEIKSGQIDWQSMKYLDLEGYTLRTKRLRPKAGDIVYGREGTFGDCAIVPAGINMSLGQRVMLFRPNETLISNQFFCALLRSDWVYQQALRNTCGSTVGHINIKDIKKFLCPVPPLELQYKFALIRKKIESQRACARQSSQKSEELFNSILQRAFKGELFSKVYENEFTECH